MDPRSVFEALVAHVAAGRSEEAASLYAADAVVSHPMAPGPALRGLEALRRHFKEAAERVRGLLTFQPAGVVVHETADPEVIVAEFEYRGQNLVTGRAFAVPCVFVLRIRGGKILESRDYMHHEGFAAVAGRAPA